MFGFENFPFKSKIKKQNEDDDSIIIDQEPESDYFDAQSLSFGFNFDEKIKSLKDLINTYRMLASNHEVEEAIDDIVNEAIIVDQNKIVTIDIDNITSVSKQVSKKISEEFKYILQLLNFNKKADELFRQFYVDGRLYAFSKIEDTKGITSIKIPSPLEMVRIKDKTDGKYYFIYKSDKKDEDKTGYRIPEDLVTFINSGLTNSTNSYYISNIHRSMKPLNQLRMLEDSAVIYRITRAPERRVFYIDVGKLPKKKAEEYVKKLMNRFKNKISYDINSGNTTQKKDVLTMLEDFYLPTSGDSKGTKIDILPSGQALGEITDILYFRKKLYKSLRVPISRMESEESPSISFGTDSELTRSELKFTKFIKKQQHKFSELFYDILYKQLVFKKIIDDTDWEKIKEEINFIWSSDNYWSQIKKNEILTTKLDILNDVSDYVGKYYSNNYIRKNILNMTNEEIENMKKEIEEEKKSGEIE